MPGLQSIYAGKFEGCRHIHTMKFGILCSHEFVLGRAEKHESRPAGVHDYTSCI